MSVMAIVKEAGTLILGTDSRFMRLDFSGPASDAEQKLFEIAPGAFIATSGRKRACDFQHTKARQLADTLGTTDIRVIAAALARESFPCLTGLVEDMRALQHIEPGIADTVAGRALLHACILAGRKADGELGFVSQSYHVQDGQVVCQSETYFGDVRKIVFTTGAPLNGAGVTFGFVQDPAIWTDPAEAVVRRILRDARESTTVSGGPDQIVCIDGNGARWIAQPPTGADPVRDDLAEANITALVSMNSPAISGGSIVGATITSTLNSVIVEMNGVYDSIVGGNSGLRVRSSGSPNFRVVIVPGGVWLIDASNVVRAQLFGDGTAKFYRSTGALSISIDGANGQVLLYDTSGVNRLWMDTSGGAGHIGVTGTGASITINGVPVS